MQPYFVTHSERSTEPSSENSIINWENGQRERESSGRVVVVARIATTIDSNYGTGSTIPTIIVHSNSYPAVVRVHSAVNLNGIRGIQQSNAVQKCMKS